MPAIVRTIAPFYNEDSGVPPPLPCMLTDQLELFGKVPPSTRLLADEVLPPMLTGTSQSNVSDRRSPDLTSRIASPLPYPQTWKSPKPRRATSTAPIPDDDDSTDSVGSSSDAESTASTLTELEDGTKIPKPPGEPGQPGRGGYNLKVALGWNAKTYQKFKKSVYALIDEHLDVTKCASAQNPTLLKLVREKATDKFPDLDDYSGCWPVVNLIMMHLKYTSSRARRQEIEIAAGKGKKPKVVSFLVA